MRLPVQVGAKEALERADAVVYDALADDALLALAPLACTRHFVGKRSRLALPLHRCLHFFVPPTLSQSAGNLQNWAEVSVVFSGVTFRGRFYDFSAGLGVQAILEPYSILTCCQQMVSTAVEMV